MTERKRLLQLALPAMAENILQMLMGMVDAYLVAQISLITVSGISVANNILTIYQAIFIALGASAASLIAKSLGQKDRRQTEQLIWDALAVTVVLGGVLGLFSFVGGRWVLTLLGTESAVSQTGGFYLAIVGGGIGFLGLMTTLGSVLRAKGKPNLSMQVSLVANVLNAILSALAVFILNWGMVGVAAATVFSRLIGCLILWRALDLNIKAISLTKPFNRDLFSLALPAAGERLMMRAGDVVIVAIIVHFGTEVVAGNAIGETLTQFNYMPGMGVATATVILVAHSLGSGDFQVTQRLAREAYWLSLWMMLPIGLLTFAFGGFLTHLYTDNSGAVAASMVVLLYSFLGTPVTAGTLVYTAVWQGLGQAKLPFYATTFGMWIIRIFLGYILGIIFNLGLAGVWIATVVDNLFRTIFLYVRYKLSYKRDLI